MCTLTRCLFSSQFCAQICWKWTKVVTDAPLRNGGGFRAFLDGSQYKLTGILRYERIFGPGFVSTGGIDTTKARRRAQLETCSRPCQPVVYALGWWAVEVAKLCACCRWKMTGICHEQTAPHPAGWPGLLIWHNLS